MREANFKDISSVNLTLWCSSMCRLTCSCCLIRTESLEKLQFLLFCAKTEFCRSSHRSQRGPEAIACAAYRLGNLQGIPMDVLYLLHNFEGTVHLSTKVVKPS